MVCLRSNLSRVSSRGFGFGIWSAHGVVSLLVLLTLALWLTKPPPFSKNRGQVSKLGELGNIPPHVWFTAPKPAPKPAGFFVGRTILYTRGTGGTIEAKVMKNHGTGSLKTGKVEASETLACWCLSVLWTAIPEFN